MSLWHTTTICTSLKSSRDPLQPFSSRLAPPQFLVRFWGFSILECVILLMQWSSTTLWRFCGRTLNQPFLDCLRGHFLTSLVLSYSIISTPECTSQWPPPSRYHFIPLLPHAFIIKKKPLASFLKFPILINLNTLDLTFLCLDSLLTNLVRENSSAWLHRA